MPRFVIPALLLSLGTSAALAQTDPSGISFVTVGAPGNAPWTGGGLNNGRGDVDYNYRIGQYEVTTAQWCEFFNAALDRPASDRIPDVFAPTQWGAVATAPNNPGGQRFTVPTGNAMLPTGGVDWRTCAVFCNWLCGGKSSDRSAFLNGAYDVSTFGYISPAGGFTDQLTHNPSAQYWIPTLDEWMKAAHYDPNRNGPGQGGWWLYSNSSQNPFVYGPAGVLVNGQPATANAAWDVVNFPGHNPFSVPLGAYAATSPWGLFDVAGGTSEWLEQSHTIPGDPVPSYRLFEGSAWATSTNGSDDQAGYYGGDDIPTYFGFDVGLRVAAAVPSPGVVSLCGAAVLLWGAPRRRQS